MLRRSLPGSTCLSPGCSRSPGRSGSNTPMAFRASGPRVGTVTAMVVSLAFLGLALKSLPVGTAYAVWTGIGAVGTVILGIILFAEPATALRLGCVGLIVAGIVGLKLVT